MMLSTQLKLLKEKRKLTNQQLSDLSGVPIGTINRILSGQTDNPSFQAVCDIVMAMDGSLDELVGIKTEAPSKDGKLPPNKDLISLYESMLESKERWMHRLFVCCCVLTLVLIGIIAFDLMNPTIGFFQK
ncbi:MAG: helix-turn-helix transcriptional regulator [Evtepia sp.]|nr:helix-turn-helix transcriptional regulator [Evtepia sp.]